MHRKHVADDAEVCYTSWLHGYPVELYGDVECMSVCIDSGIASQLNGWRAESCSQDQSVGVVCHKGRLSRRLTSKIDTSDPSLMSIYFGFSIRAT